MDCWRNDSGRPLSSQQWLQNHHRAKLVERERFAQRLADLKPRTIVDIGCGVGLWLELLDRVLPPGCELIGIDSDSAAIESAQERSRGWSHCAKFRNEDVETAELPAADLLLCFNMFGYFERKELLLRRLKDGLQPEGTIVVRQYDGATMRLGRLDQDARLRIDASLYASVAASQQFGHYAMDDTLKAVSDADFQRVSVEFETFFRLSPFDASFRPYVTGTAEWMASYVADSAQAEIKNWLERSMNERLHYFCEIDLVCWLS